MDKDKKNRLRILKKQNQLNNILPNLLTRLARIEPQFYNAKNMRMEEVEYFLSRLRGEGSFFETMITKITTKQTPQIIYTMFDKISKYMDKENYFSISKLRELWFVEINTKFIVENFEKIIQIDGDTFYIYDKNLKNGLCVDLSDDYFIKDKKVTYEPVYEFKIWGNEWANEFLK